MPGAGGAAPLPSDHRHLGGRVSVISPAVVLSVRVLSPRPIARSIFLISAHVKPRRRYLFRCFGRMCWMSSFEAVVIPGCHGRAGPLVIFGTGYTPYPHRWRVVRVLFPVPWLKWSVPRGNECPGGLLGRGLDLLVLGRPLQVVGDFTGLDASSAGPRGCFGRRLPCPLGLARFLRHEFSVGRVRLPNEARFYDPNVGRFTQPDPSGLETNPYLYASGDPTNRIDPSGLFSVGNFLQGVGSGLVAVAAGAAAVTTAPACVTVVGCIPTVAEAGIALGAAGASYEFFKEAF